MTVEKMRVALRSLIDTVNVTGGVIRDAEGFVSPAVDPEWTDLGSAYIEACEALGEDPEWGVSEE